MTTTAAPPAPPVPSAPPAAAPPRAARERARDRVRSWAGRPYLRLSLLSALAAALAFGLGAWLPLVSPVVAAITALVSVRPTFHASLREALLQVLGVVLGGLVALAVVLAVGYSAVALFVALAAVFGLARLLRLGEEGAIAVGVTVILVTGPHVSADAVEQRLLGVAVGAAVALLASLVTRPGTPSERALAGLLRRSDDTAVLLTAVAEALEDGAAADPETAAEWLARAERLHTEVVGLRLDAEDAVRGSRWTPLADREQAEAVLDQARLTEATVLTVVGMCRDLLAAARRRGALPTPVAASISGVMLATAGAISEQTAGARAHPAEALSEQTGPVPAAASSRREATAAVRGLEDTMPLRLGGALLRDTETITELLAGRGREPSAETRPAAARRAGGISGAPTGARPRPRWPRRLRGRSR